MHASPLPRSAEHSVAASIATEVARYRSHSFTILGPPPSLPEGTNLLDDPNAIWVEEEWSQERLRQAEESEVCRFFSVIDMSINITTVVGVLTMHLPAHRRATNLFR